MINVDLLNSSRNSFDTSLKFTPRLLLPVVMTFISFVSFTCWASSNGCVITYRFIFYNVCYFYAFLLEVLLIICRNTISPVLSPM